MENDERKRDIIDEEHLRLLSLFHYIKGALTVGFSLFGILYFLFISSLFNMIGRIEGRSHYYAQEFPHEIFSYLMFFMWILILLFLTFGVLQIFSGYYIKNKRARMFSFIIGIIHLIEIPYGTILGIMTILVLSRSSVEDKYRKKQVSPPRSQDESA
jgi:hypothetical protein